MASWQARTLSFLLRHTFKRSLARAKSAAQARAVLNSGRFPTPREVSFVEATLGGVPGEWVEPRTGSPPAALLYLHGGGYFACSPRSHRPYTGYFARQGFRVYAPAYRLAPEHKFPAALEDAVSACRALRTGIAGAAPLFLAGDSAGGGLALATMLSLRDTGEPLPSAAVLFSPLTDLAGTGASRQFNDARCAMFRAAAFAFVAEFYLDGVDPRHPLASPLFADLRGLPPLLIHVGADETLLDDSTQFAARARAAGVSVDLKIWPAVSHVWQLSYPFVPEARQSLEEGAAFLRRHFPEAVCKS